MTAQQQINVAFIEQPPEEVDRIYAKSLFEIAEQRGGRTALEEVANELEQLVESAMRDPQVREFFNSKVITAADKERVLSRAFHERADDLVSNFFLLLARRERLDRFRRIVAAFDELMQAKFGIVEVDVYTRYPLERSEIEAIRTRLHDAMKREPVVHAYTDETMIGGIKIQVGDKLLDASVDAQLRNMRTKLMEEGGGALRARIDRIIND